MTENYSKQPLPDGIVFRKHPKNKQFKDLTGKKLHYLLVLGLGPLVENWKSNCSTFWWCRCDCGSVKLYNGNNLKRETIKSCGCMASKLIARSRTSHGRTRSREYRTWSAMKTRCYDKNSPSYEYYGPSGIVVCDRWLQSFENFYEDMGEKPKGKSLGRINNLGNYCKENCRWEDHFQQNRNRRNTVMAECRGEVRPLTQWLEESGITRSTFEYRKRSGMSDEDILIKKS